MSDEVDIPELPRVLRAPEPVIVVGMLSWVVATLVVALAGIGGDKALQICLVGLGVGLLGTTIVVVQKTAVRRGAKGAQVGLD